MNNPSPETLKKIRLCAAEEFAKKGFRGASLRNIVKSAGVTTGAFYGYYESKEQLFSALVGDHADRLTEIFVNGQKSLLENISRGDKAGFMEINSARLTAMTELSCNERGLTKLLLISADGTPYEGFVHRIAEAETQATCRLRANMRSDNSTQLDPYFEHIIISGMLSSMFEPVIHGASKDRCIKLAEELAEFYGGGLCSLMFP